ncbi:PilZ domain-containing protein [Mariprofundus sp. KV]|uniref:PilZ domain-containing protein n=1 Tax=Mariprofundus sp. KV TaxID=2608715 RepID=UPI0015A2207C|nr:PilZ domain-containing protein [Mariprofundus sp. KV]NWF36057.1 hypothetical protein [Mariprofundus sp. KV]
MSSERRSSGRRALELPAGSGLALYSNNQPINVLEVLDLSPFGIGLEVDSRIETGCRVSLSYHYTTTDIEVHGTVVWSSGRSEDGPAVFRVGIYLQEDESALNVELFNAMTAR